MAKSKRATKADKPLPPIASLMRREALLARQSALDVITPEQRAKGSYSGSGRRITNQGGK